MGQSAPRPCHRDTELPQSKSFKPFCYNNFRLAYQLLFHSPVKPHVQIAFVLALVALPLQCATLEQLSLPSMIVQSTAIVRAKVVSSYAAMSGPVVYTHYQLQVSERYKGTAQSTVDVAIPGGVANGFRQVWGGAPQLASGAEYVFFLWTGKSGLTQVMGLTQGLFAIELDGSTDPAVTRTASRELMLDHKTGRPVQDQTLAMPLSGLRAQIAAALTPQGNK